MGVKVAPRFARGVRAAEHSDGPEGTEPLVATIIGEQEFPTPKGTVVAPSQAVKNDAEHRRCVEGPAVLGQAGSDMGVMVLNFHQREWARLRPFARQF